jgi:hypothetical protein
MPRLHGAPLVVEPRERRPVYRNIRAYPGSEIEECEGNGRGASI